MHEQKKNDSKHASIHQIVTQNKRKLRKQQITQLFSTPNLSQLDLSQCQHHPYMLTNDMFTFFVHELEKWNKKVRNSEVKPFYHAELNRNMFLLSSLKIICLKKPNEIKRYLEDLTLWYNKNSYNVPQPSVLMKKYNPNEQWEIRKTFKSNTPSQIGNYRRRFLCSPDEKDGPFAENLLLMQKKKQNCFFETRMCPTKTYENSKSMNDDALQSRRFTSEQPFRQIMRNKDNKLVRIGNNQIRRKRQQNEISQAQESWKVSHSRFGQKSCQNFFRGKFNKNKQFSEIQSGVQPRKIQTAGYNYRRSQQIDLISNIKKGRIRTSLGIRKNFGRQQNSANLGQRSTALKTQSNEQAKDQETPKWIDTFVVDEDKIDIRNTFNSNGYGMVLISNPFDTGKNKIKKKKR